ncbi:MAG: hypothetical protein A2487_06190 [Candidatus Raymondbacteria bacterium RifOxyC12_full_50_8]|uniref:Bacterial surface antigen (D15) domain-containing protein n=1 Tax=Candidatus Raymondbacteria bacterium RIFOXYD12_FULL_49_13 TaxID=1817890 RepID=A0A1F7F9D8_UNCRA|nr:MAG: hypothetical protein A2248_18555 [Candidatus Raymondbacteria bacterium RIFOXYA2_FULL_49_16]OGJ99491.1 MAG: hypothetical protein A2487_06190 [Candidatus Raymondbacteria bacterium RifOxyC12_full_50_8]OGK03280.1 MAG: hypothetical protein A2519_13210 [Candidatus Raymondbacteria bacterium RIFOXYD12_FULL_49_13]OGP41553.1 MAG: hypothetical protein A2324_09730 [Candidatus Raymondbacteria bacterium RIFOXYB2_FULL_49_35]
MTRVYWRCLVAAATLALHASPAPVTYSLDSVSRVVRVETGAAHRMRDCRIALDSLTNGFPDSAMVVLHHEEAYINCAGLARDLSLLLVARGGAAVLTMPEEARVVVHCEKAFLTRLHGNGLYGGPDLFIKQGTGPQVTIWLSAYGGSLHIQTPDDSIRPPMISIVGKEKVARLVRYNRVEGLFAGFEFDTRDRTGLPYGIAGNIGYAFMPEVAQYRLCALVTPDTRRRLTLGFEYFRAIESVDTMVVSVFENSLAMLFAGRDFMDYYLTTTARARGIWSLSHGLVLSGSFGSAFYHPLGVATRFFLFGSDTLVVRANPLVAEAEDRFITAAIAFSNASKAFPRSGVNGNAGAEYSGGRIGSGFAYRKITADVRGFAAISGRTEVGCRLFTGEITGKNGRGAIPVQKLFDLGGMGTVRGLPFREDPQLLDRDRIFLVSAEYKRLMDARRKAQALFVVFADWGCAWNAEDKGADNTGFNNLFSQIRTDMGHATVGLAVADREENVRLSIMRGFSSGSDIYYDKVTLRLQRAF